MARFLATKARRQYSALTSALLIGNPPLGWCGPTRARSARVVPIAHGSLVVTRRVQLKRARFRENGFIEGKKRFQLCFVRNFPRGRGGLRVVLPLCLGNWRSWPDFWPRRRAGSIRH